MEKNHLFICWINPRLLQTTIFAGHVAPPVSDDNIGIESMNNILGGSFTSRINMNLREDKHWSYVSGSFIAGTKAQRPFVVYALIQTDKTKESIQEVYNELKDIISTRPPSEDELNKIKLQQTLELPGSWETMGAIGNSIYNIVENNLSDDYYDTYPDKVKNLSVTDLSNAAKKVVHPENVIWVVVGDKNLILEPLKTLGFDIKFIDGDGNLLSGEKTL